MNEEEEANNERHAAASHLRHPLAAVTDGSPPRLPTPAVMTPIGVSSS